MKYKINCIAVIKNGNGPSWYRLLGWKNSCDRNFGGFGIKLSSAVSGFSVPTFFKRILRNLKITFEAKELEKVVFAFQIFGLCKGDNKKNLGIYIIGERLEHARGRYENTHYTRFWNLLRIHEGWGHQENVWYSRFKKWYLCRVGISKFLGICVFDVFWCVRRGIMFFLSQTFCLLCPKLSSRILWFVVICKKCPSSRKTDSCGVAPEKDRFKANSIVFKKTAVIVGHFSILTKSPIKNKENIANFANNYRSKIVRKLTGV